MNTELSIIDFELLTERMLRRVEERMQEIADKALEEFECPGHDIDFASEVSDAVVYAMDNGCSVWRKVVKEVYAGISDNIYDMVGDVVYERVHEHEKEYHTSA